MSPVLMSPSSPLFLLCQRREGFHLKMNRDSDFFPQGLNKTFVTMDQERPRCELSINSRNDLRRVLHLEFLYKENKVLTCLLKCESGGVLAARAWQLWQEVWGLAKMTNFRVS